MYFRPSIVAGVYMARRTMQHLSASATPATVERSVIPCVTTRAPAPTAHATVASTAIEGSSARRASVLAGGPRARATASVTRVPATVPAAQAG